MNNTTNNSDNNNNDGNNNKTLFWVAVGCCALGAVTFGLAFTALGVYSMLASMILELAGVSFLNGQKRACYFTACKVLRVICYVIMVAGFAVLLGLAAYKLD